MKKLTLITILSILLVATVIAGIGLSNSDSSVTLTTNVKNYWKETLDVTSLNLKTGITTCNDNRCSFDIYNVKSREICDAGLTNYLIEQGIALNKNNCYDATIDQRVGRTSFTKVADNQLTSARDTALVNYMTKVAERTPSTSEDKLGEGVITVN